MYTLIYLKNKPLIWCCQINQKYNQKKFIKNNHLLEFDGSGTQNLSNRFLQNIVILSVDNSSSKLFNCFLQFEKKDHLIIFKTKWVEKRFSINLPEARKRFSELLL